MKRKKQTRAVEDEKKKCFNEINEQQRQSVSRVYASRCVDKQWVKGTTHSVSSNLASPKSVHKSRMKGKGKQQAGVLKVTIYVKTKNTENPKTWFVISSPFKLF
jgi:hypothetical protein